MEYVNKIVFEEKARMSGMKSIWLTFLILVENGPVYDFCDNWRALIRVNKLEKIMEVLENESQREDISLKNDIYPFILSHRNIFHVDAHRSGFQAWKKQVYNCLFHNKQRFQKGRQDGTSFVWM